MKKLICLLTVLVLLLGLPCSTWVSAAGTVTVSADKTTVTVGGTVTVTAKYDGGGKGIGSLDAYFRYNAKYFEYVSCSGATANGGAGSVKMSYFCQEATAPKTVTISITLKAIAAGSGDFKWETEGMYDDEDTLLGTPSKSLSVSASNPSLSGDATLKTLYPTKGTLVPKFDKNVTEYTVSVPYTVTKGLLVFDPTDPNAESVVTENATLKVGKTTRVITVTAPNGTVKKYTVVFTREADQNTTTGSTGTGTTTAPSATTPEVEIDGVYYTVAEEQPSATLPAGFAWDYITLGENEVVAAKMEKGSLVLLYLTEKEADTGAFYVYDAAKDSFAPFRQLANAGNSYVLHELPASETAPIGTVTGTVTIGEQTVTAYVYEDPALADYAILYLTAQSGDSGLYTYDKAEGTLQRYHAVTVEKDVTVTPDPQVENNGFIAFMEAHYRLILVCAAALAGLAALIIVVVWIISHTGGSKGKH